MKLYASTRNTTDNDILMRFIDKDIWVKVYVNSKSSKHNSNPKYDVKYIRLFKIYLVYDISA